MTESEFWTHVDKSGDCWLWTAARNGNGYGSVYYQGSCQPTHRAAWRILRGEIPDGLNVLHCCDVRLCVNPDHLFLGTQADNQADMVAKGRSAGGVRNGSKTHPERITHGLARWNCKLSGAQVRDIRKLHAAGDITQKALADKFGTTYQNIHCIIKGKSRRRADLTNEDMIRSAKSDRKMADYYARLFSKLNNRLEFLQNNRDVKYYDRRVEALNKKIAVVKLKLAGKRHAEVGRIFKMNQASVAQFINKTRRLVDTF